MALEKLRESVTLTGESKIDGVLVAAFTSNVASNGVAGPVSVNIRDVTRYNEQRNVVRQDQADFQQTVWEIEDRLTVQNAEEAEQE